MLVGTGVACVTKDYGTGADCSLGTRGDRPPTGRISIHVRRSRDGQRHRHGARQPRGGAISAAVADEVTVAQIDAFDALGARHLRRSVHDGPGDAGRRRAQPALGARRSAPRPARRSARMSARMRRRRRRASSSASACGRRRSSCGASRPTRSARRNGSEARWQDGQLILAGSCRRCRCRSSPPRAHARNLVTGAMAHGFSRWAWSRARFPMRRASTGTPTSMRSRVRRGGGKYRSGSTGVSVKLPADRQQPHRHRVHLAVRHAGARRDRARDRRAAHRQGLQRVRMRPGAGAGGGARAGAGRLRDGRRLRAARVAAALRGRPRQRRSGISAST